MNNSWNTIFTFDNFDNEHKLNIQNYFKLRSSQKFAKEKTAKLQQESKNYLEKMYNDGYGLKVLGRELEISYSSMRTLLNWLNIEIRKGTNVITEPLKKFRKERISNGNNHWCNWNQNEKYKYTFGRERTTQGYFIKKDNTKVWLRSSWEYIFAKWLEKQNINWDIEYKVYKLSNGENYTPDFFIFENGIIKQIIEIKGFWKNRIHKIELLKKSLKDIECILIENIKMFSENYNKDIKEWKQMQQEQQK